MLDIESLIKTYSSMLETLKEIKKQEEGLKGLETLRTELKKTRQECEDLKKKIKWNEKHINVLSNYLGDKICPDCGGDGGFEGYEGDGGPCETCKTSGVVPLK